MSSTPRACLALAVLEGADAGRSFRFSGDAPINLRRRSDPDDDGLALRTDEADGLHVVVLRGPDGWTVERREGPALEVDGVCREHALLGDGTTIRIGETLLAVSFFADKDLGTPTPPTAGTDAGPDTDPPPEDEFDADADIAGFECLELIAEGAGARTWLARRAGDPALVALKVVRRDAGPAARRDLRRATEIAAFLEGHPHAAQFVASDIDAPIPWLALRWVEGEPIEELVEREGPLPIPDACAVAAQVLRVLDVIHARGYVHRDIHPGNILWSDRSVPNAVDAVLIDFGLGKAVRAEASERTINPTVTGEWMGRPRFLAPEQAEDGKHVGPPADLYGVASTLYWMLCRAPVIRERPGESVLASWVRGHRVPIRRRRADVPESLAIVLDQALSRDPAIRWEAKRPLLAEIERLAGVEVEI